MACAEIGEISSFTILDEAAWMNFFKLLSTDPY